MSIEPEIANMAGAAALPRKNGELVFHEPWEGRAFGMALALKADGAYDWEDFRQRLIFQIQAADCKSGAAPDYYEHWLGAFESLLVERGILGREEVDRRVAEYKSGERDEVF
jgi:nitrile hydratase accessory protein